MLGEDRLVFRDEAGVIEDQDGFLAGIESENAPVFANFANMGVAFTFADGSELNLPDVIDFDNEDHVAFWQEQTLEGALDLVGVAFDAAEIA